MNQVDDLSFGLTVSLVGRPLSQGSEIFHSKL